MNEITVKVNAPEGCEPVTTVLEDGSVKIDWKKIDNRPKSWREYQKLVIVKKGYHGENAVSRGSLSTYNTFNTPEESKAFIALGKLIQLRDAWLEDWKANWDDENNKWCISNYRNKIRFDSWYITSHILAFPTKEMRDEFHECFKDLIEEAKMFL